jgi:hypothetical protein
MAAAMAVATSELLRLLNFTCDASLNPRTAGGMDRSLPGQRAAGGLIGHEQVHTRRAVPLGTAV